MDASSLDESTGRGPDEKAPARGPDENTSGSSRDDVKTSPTGRQVPPSATPTTSSDDAAPLGHRDVVARQREQFGGMKFGSAFFGWLAATGMGVLLTTLVGAGTAIGLGRTGQLPDPNTANVETVGLVGGIVVGAVVFLAYFCGGYVAGRMARFNGIKQGIAVWIWAIIIAIIVAIIGATAGSQFDLLANVNGFPRIPVNEGALTTAGVITAVAVAVLSLVGAILGGLAGMRFHRRVDKAGLD